MAEQALFYLAGVGLGALLLLGLVSLPLAVFAIRDAFRRRRDR